MSRSTTALAMTTLALFVGWRTAAAQVPTPPSTTVPCPLELGKQANVSVDGNAVADPACISVKKGKTEVVWTGTADVKRLLITFKDPATKHPPEDPECSGARCVLEKAKHAAKEGEFDYSVVVVRQDGTTATVDPKLIILPVAP